MDRDSARKAAEVMLAYADGKEIEAYDAVTKEWGRCDNPQFVWCDNNDYRVKPTSTYRPFANADECWEEMKKHEPFGWVKTPLKRKTIDVVASEVHVACEERGYTFEEAYDTFTFADGQPFGKLTEEE